MLCCLSRCSPSTLATLTLTATLCLCLRLAATSDAAPPVSGVGSCPVYRSPLFLRLVYSCRRRYVSGLALPTAGPLSPCLYSTVDPLVLALSATSACATPDISALCRIYSFKHLVTDFQHRFKFSRRELMPNVLSPTYNMTLLSKDNALGSSFRAFSGLTLAFVQD